MRLFGDLMDKHRNSGAFLDCFNGERDMKETTVIRQAVNMFNGDFFVVFEDSDNPMYEFDLDKRHLKGLFPLNYQEFVVYMCAVLEHLFPYPYVSFLRDCFDEWFLRSPLRFRKPEIDAFLDYLEITV